MAEDDDKPRGLSRAEKFKNYCVGFGALTALILGAWANLKGEPTARKAWDVSEKQLNKNRRAINDLSDGLRKLHLMFVHTQGQQEGYNNAKLLQQIEQLKKANEELRKGKTTAAVSSNNPTVAAKPPKKDCHPGWVRVKGKCTKNRTAIAKAAVKAQEDVARVEKKLEKERKLRKAAERAKMQMQQIRIPEPKPPAKLAPVPKALDDAVKH